MWGHEIRYRAIGSTNSTMRRLSYLTDIVRAIGRNEISERSLLVKLHWDEDARQAKRRSRSGVDVGQCGIVKSYLRLAKNVGLISPTSPADTYRLTRRGGGVLFCLCSRLC